MGTETKVVANCKKGVVDTGEKTMFCGDRKFFYGNDPGQIYLLKHAARAGRMCSMSLLCSNSTNCLREKDLKRFPQADFMQMVKDFESPD